MSDLVALLRAPRRVLLACWHDRRYWRRRLTCWHDWRIGCSYKGNRWCAKCGVWKRARGQCCGWMPDPELGCAWTREA